MSRDENLTLQYAGCAGCVGAGVLLLAGGGLALYGYSNGNDMLVVIGIALSVLSVVIGAVSSVVNNLGFGRNLAERFDKRR